MLYHLVNEENQACEGKIVLVGEVVRAYVEHVDTQDIGDLPGWR